MPTISAFYGLVIRMYHREHGPPHFHVYYQEHQATIDLETLEILAGHLPRRAIELVLDWAELHRTELRENWALAAQRQALHPIRPLE